MIENLSTIEIWTLARVLAGHPMTTRRDQLSEKVLELCRYIGSIAWKDRQMTLRMQLSPVDFGKVEAMDSESPMPGTPPKPSTEPEFAFYSLPELLRLPKMTWLIPGLLPSRGLCMVYGPSGAGKSFWALDTAYKLAFDVPVVYIVAEGEGGMPERIMALLKHHKATPQNLTFVLGVVDLFDGNELATFTGLAEKYAPRLIVVDTLAMCTGTADENSTRDMKIIIDSCKRISRSLQTAVMFVHHTNKEGRQARGSGRLFNDCDTVIRLTRQDDVIAVESQKTKDRGRFKTYYLKELSIPLGYKDDQGEDVASLVLLPSDKVVSEGLTDNQIKILESLSIEPTASFNDLAQTTELTRGVVVNAIRRLTKQGYLTPPNGTGGRRLTDLGQKAIGDSTDSGDSGDSRNPKYVVRKPSESGESVNQQGENVNSSESLESRKPRQRSLMPDNRIHTSYDDGA